MLSARVQTLLRNPSAGIKSLDRTTQVLNSSSISNQSYLYRLSSVLIRYSNFKIIQTHTCYIIIQTNFHIFSYFFRFGIGILEVGFGLHNGANFRFVFQKRSLWTAMEVASKKAVTPESMSAEAKASIASIPQSVMDTVQKEGSGAFHELLQSEPCPV